MKKLTTEELYARIEIHRPMLTLEPGQEYVAMDSPMQFSCHDHGYFTSTPEKVFRAIRERAYWDWEDDVSAGCPDCSKRVRAIQNMQTKMAEWQKQEERENQELIEARQRRAAQRKQGWRYHPYNAKTGQVINYFDGSVMYSVSGK